MSKMEEAVPAGPVRAQANRLKEEMERKGAVVEICGSLRREKEMVKDIDFITNISAHSASLILEEYAESMGLPYEQFSCGEKRLSAALDRMPLQVIAIPLDSWGAGLLFSTGSKFFNIMLRHRAKWQGMKLNQYGLYCNEEVIASRTEEQILWALGYDFIPPINRDRGLFKV